MPIRLYQSGDEEAQARIYNIAAAALPGFKPSKPEEIARRYQAADSDSKMRFYATENGEVVGYAVFSSYGRVSFPWCLPGTEMLREPLFDAMISEMKQRNITEAWAAYRVDWSPVLAFLCGHEFIEKRRMVNFVAEISSLPVTDHLPANRVVERLQRNDLPRIVKLTPALFADTDVHTLDRFLWDNPFYRFPESLLALKDPGTGEIHAVSLLVSEDRFADPSNIDSSMPCFRFGAFGTERERHKRVNGLFSCVFRDESDADLLLYEAIVTTSGTSNLTLLAAQAPSDSPALCSWYARHFQRQGAFPILSRKLLP
jgi:hypothetical protein